MSDNRPGVGAAILVWRDSSKRELLVGRGHNSASEEIYALAGGHIESGETLVQAAVRECFEESGVGVKNLRLLTVYEFFNTKKSRQFITVAFEGEWDGTAPVPEKGKRESWDWYTLEEALQLPLFESDEVLLSNVRKGICYDASVERAVYRSKR